MHKRNYMLIHTGANSRSVSTNVVFWSQAVKCKCVLGGGAGSDPELLTWYGVVMICVSPRNFCWSLQFTLVGGRMVL